MVSYRIARLSCAPVPLAGQDANIAQMAELVDALGSGPSGGNTVEVRVLSWAPDSKVKPLTSGFTFCVRPGDPLPVDRSGLRG